MKRIYLDTAAGTAPNPSSLHAEGRAAAQALAAARLTVANFLHAHADEIIFTSGGTEANNLAIWGVPPGVVAVSAVEHASVLAPAAARAAAGLGEMIVLPVDSTGRIRLDALADILSPELSLVSIMWANNEIGTIEPIKLAAKIIRDWRRRHRTARPYFHVDACQATRFFDLDVRKLHVDLLTINSSKVYGPPGVGALFARRGLRLMSRSQGGGQEAGRRAGTENVPGIVGFARALKKAEKERLKEAAKLAALRDYFIAQVMATIPGAKLNGPSGANRLPNNINFSFAGVLGEQVVLELDACGIAASTGSACAIPNHNESYVILALGQAASAARGAVRFSLGRATTKADLTFTLKRLQKIINQLREANYAYAASLNL